MKRFLMLVGVAVVAAAMYVAASPGASQRSSVVSEKQFLALQNKVNTLSKTLKKVKAEANDADGFIRSCMLPPSKGGVLPINDYGDPAGTFGYQYFNGTTTIDTTAIDVDPQPSNTTAWITAVDPTCVGALKHHAAGHVGGNRMALHSLRAR
jgi:hypothetical protein